MKNQIVMLALMGLYAFVFAVIWTIFEKRLKIIHRRHVEKCQPFGQKGLDRIDNRLKIVIRSILLLLFVASMTTIYLMAP